MEEALREKIDNGTALVGVIGLGYVGLPLALVFTEKGSRVLGFDIDPHKVELPGKGECHIRHIDRGRVAAANESGRAEYACDFDHLEEPDPRCARDFFLPFSSEREDPGNKRCGTADIPKIIGGVDAVSGQIAQALYDKAICRTVMVSSARAAEATKLTENIFRALNIALVNELKVTYDRMGIDIWEVLDAASTKPFGFMRFNPGPGWGGHCIPLDPFYLTWKAREYEVATRFIELAGDIRNEIDVQKAVAGVDYVLHQAALPSVPRSLVDPITTNDVNIGGTLRLLIEANKAHVKRFVFASSSSVYGDNPTQPRHEDLVPQPLSPYAVSKLAGEYYCRVYFHVYGLPVVMLRYFNVFGPRQDPNSQYAAVIPIFIRQSRLGEPCTIYGDGTQTRDFTYVANVVDVNLLACEKPGAIGHVLNIGCGETCTINELRCELTRHVSSSGGLHYAPCRPGDAKDSCASTEKARLVLGYAPTIGWRVGIEKTVQSSSCH